ncbi:MAG: long-chain-fatty-acid--CoA ligase [Methyloligellaceae bacterium]
MNEMSNTPTSGDPVNLRWTSSYNPGVDWNMEITPEPIFSLLDKSVAEFPKNKCTSFMGKDLTYQEIGDLTDRVTKGLQEQGIGKGSRVGIFLSNCPYFIIFYNAILKTGATVVNFNPLYSIPELEFMVKDSGTEVMVTLDVKATFDSVEKLLASGTLSKAIVCPMAQLLPAKLSILFKLFKGKEVANYKSSAVANKVIQYNDLIKNDGKYRHVNIDIYRDVALLQYTGGTTGRPKGAMLSHSNLYHNVQQCLGWFTEREPGKEVVVGILPFFHVFAMTVVMNFGISLGAEIVMFARFDIKKDLKVIQAKKPTLMPTVPTLLTGLMSLPNLKDYDLSSLKFCQSGGAPLPVEVLQGFEKMTGAVISEGYGLSETSPVVASNPTKKPKVGSIGTPMPRTIISIRNLENPDQEMPIGERGEICIKGPQVMMGYWNKPEATAEAFVGDYLRTGDIGIMDEEGYIYIVDRIKDLIICSGYNVYPRMIEEAIYKYPGVEEVTVIGIPDNYRGEAPKAFVKMLAGQTATQEEMLGFLQDQLSKIEMPAEIEFRDELPKTMIGKLSKKELRQEEA